MPLGNILFPQSDFDDFISTHACSWSLIEIDLVLVITISKFCETYRYCNEGFLGTVHMQLLRNISVQIFIQCNHSSKSGLTSVLLNGLCW